MVSKDTIPADLLKQLVDCRHVHILTLHITIEQLQEGLYRAHTQPSASDLAESTKPPIFTNSGLTDAGAILSLIQRLVGA